MASSSAVDLELYPPSAPLTGVCGVLIPAFNEAATVASVVKAAQSAELGPVLVVDDGSSDETGELARSAGATVLRLGQNSGKGGAVFEGASVLQTDVILLVDADLVGLTAHHLSALAAPVLAGEADMTRGVFEGGRWRTTAAQRITPQLNGQRAIRRRCLLGVPGLRDSRYGVEIAITEEAKRRQWRTFDVPLENVSQIMKEEKRGIVEGLQVRLSMYRDILTTWLKNLLQR